MRNLPFCVLTLAGVAAWLIASAGPAAAGDWCSFHLSADSIVDCGYSSYAECRDKAGGGNVVCIPDPDHAELTTPQRKRAG
jgi:hypothetical protein